ncbi:migration and invasion-inhibitory protein isoform X7 [Bos indicus x Bos taurus]|uniref:migration and invasion-inhibitory protein isoform X7 n=1 Tax=Bos indicus x Bos taurus TaxID=30522 RepID=UPI000F7D42B3|nr:migration and invasion-inhibitory protein isoform X7 [Bos indicus x Bos taurus]
MVETRDLVQLRQLNLELLRQLWVRQDAVRRSVAKAASESSLDSSSSYDSEMPSSQEMSSVASRASCPQDAHPGDPCGRYWPGDASSGMNSLLPATCLYRESLGPPRPHSVPLLAISDSSDPELSAELDSPGTQEAQALRSILARQGKLSKPRVTNKESPVPEKSWRLRPYLGYDWIAGSLDNTFPITSKPEAFFSKLQKFREANKEECICSGPEPQFLGLQESDAVEGDHECVYCYRVNRRLFLVPADPGTPCRLCRKPRDQRGAGTLAEPAQVSTACWAGTLSLRNLRKAQPPKPWTSGPVSSLRPTIRSCQPPAVLTWLCQRGSHPRPQSGQNPPPCLGPAPPSRSPEDWPLGGERCSCHHISFSPQAGVPTRGEPCPVLAGGGLRPHLPS